MGTNRRAYDVQCGSNWFKKEGRENRREVVTDGYLIKYQSSHRTILQSIFIFQGLSLHNSPPVSCYSSLLCFSLLTNSSLLFSLFHSSSLLYSFILPYSALLFSPPFIASQQLHATVHSCTPYITSYFSAWVTWLDLTWVDGNWIELWQGGWLGDQRYPTSLNYFNPVTIRIINECQP